MKRWLYRLVWVVFIPVAGFAAGSAVVRAMRWFNEPPAVQAGDFSRYVQSVGSPVVLLSTTTCPWCEKTRHLLASEGIAYRDCVVDRDAFARELLGELGGSVVPRLVSASSLVNGYHEELMLDLARGAPALTTPPERMNCDLPETPLPP
jgi:glutaredoxin